MAKVLGIFTKPIETVTPADVVQLTTESWPEGYTVEFKRTLPEKKGGSDAWITGSNKIGDFARDEILSEVVAFANAQGGTLILGIDETNDKPPRAGSIMPLPRVGELARRFEDASRSCIDPPLPRLQVQAVVTDAASSSGVLIFRTAPSRSAPHRLNTTLESYSRHGSSTVRMTMREIQDMTLNVVRGLAGIDATFDVRRKAFIEWGDKRSKSPPLGAFRVTAVPLEQLPDPGRIFDQPGLFPYLRNFTIVADKQRKEVSLEVNGCSERPILRGMARYADNKDDFYFRQELHQSGLVDIWWGVPPGKIGQTPAQQVASFTFWHQYVLAGVLQAMHSTDMFRKQVGAPEAEYGLELEIRKFGSDSLRAIYYGLLGNAYGLNQPGIEEPVLLLPRISFGDPSSFNTALNQIDIDVYDALGARRQNRISLAVTL